MSSFYRHADTFLQRHRQQCRTITTKQINRAAPADLICYHNNSCRSTYRFSSGTCSQTPTFYVSLCLHLQSLQVNSNLHHWVFRGQQSSCKQNAMLPDMMNMVAKGWLFMYPAQQQKNALGWSHVLLGFSRQALLYSASDWLTPIFWP